jgi:hypothetical protein
MKIKKLLENKKLLEELEFELFERRIWKEVELARKNGVRFEPYKAITKSTALGSESNHSAPSPANP